jgi:FkbM family methyltransferase
VSLIHDFSFWTGSITSGLGSKIIKTKDGFSYKRVNNETIFKLREGTTDRFIIWEVWKLKEYDKKTFEIHSNDVIVDIGAQIGAFSVFASQKAPLGHVYSYEPIPENFQLLKENISINKLKNVTCCQRAVLSTTGDEMMYVEKFNSGGHSKYQRRNNSAIKIKSVTLKDIFETNKINRINLLKIDVEGSEYEIILETQKKYLDKIDKIIMEYHDYYQHGHTYHKLVEKLELSGFKVSTGGYFLQQHIFKSGFIQAYK